MIDAQTEIRNLTGIGQKLARRIINDLADGDARLALAIISGNPYRLTEVEGIAFKRADAVAVKDYGLSLDDPRRHFAGNRYILEQRGVLTEREFRLERGKLSLTSPDHLFDGVEVEEGRVWLPEELEAEKALARWLRGIGPANPPAELCEAQRARCDAMGLDDIQREAVQLALSNPVLCLTGGAGCGKTHVIAAVAACLSIARKKLRGAAFAGKAADRMREAFDGYGLPNEASTIHRMLGYHPRTGWGDTVIDADLIVLDEASMLPNMLVHVVEQALKTGAHLLLVGDPNQLPPIGYGTPFVDAIKHGVPRTHLSRNYRQADQQGILHMAEAILAGHAAPASDCVDLRFGVTDLDGEFDRLIEQHGGPEFEQWQCITWRNEDVERYNLRAQAIINPHGETLFEYPCWKLGTGERGRPLHSAQVRQGDKILIVKNSTDYGIFNGQTGRAVDVVNRRRRRWVVVSKLSAEYRRHLRLETHEELLAYLKEHGEKPVPENTARIEVENMSDPEPHLLVSIGNGEPVALPLDDAGTYLQLGYVITVHKAQGSDWPTVIIMQPGKVRDDTARRWFYTAVTRAKSHLVVVSAQGRVGWWINATTTEPETDSTLTVRLAATETCYQCGELAHSVEMRWDMCPECAAVAEAGRVHPAAYARFIEPVFEAAVDAVAQLIEDYDPSDPFDERNPLPPLTGWWPESSPADEQLPARLQLIREQIAAMNLEAM